MFIQRNSGPVGPRSSWALAGALLATLPGCLSAKSAPDDTVQERIINGTVPAQVPSRVSESCLSATALGPW